MFFWEHHFLPILGLGERSIRLGDQAIFDNQTAFG
jgi:hypothetical protein